MNRKIFGTVPVTGTIVRNVDTPLVPRRAIVNAAQSHQHWIATVLKMRAEQSTYWLLVWRVGAVRKYCELG